MEKTEKTLIPGQLLKYLIWLWIGAINIGVDFGFIMKGPKTIPATLILLTLLCVGIFFAVNATIGIIRLFREEVAEVENQLI